MSYKNVQFHVLNKPYVFKFKPVVPASSLLSNQGLTTFSVSPRLTSKDKNHLHYGQSFYFFTIDQTSSGVTQSHNVVIRISCKL